MRDLRSYCVYPSDINLPRAFAKAKEALSRLGFEEVSSGCDQIRYSVHLPAERRLSSTVYSEFLEILNDYPHPKAVFTHSHWKTKNAPLSLDIDVSSRNIEIAVSGGRSDILAVHDTLKDVFRASNPEADRSPSLSQYNLKKSVFLAHRFDETGKSAAEPIRIFLRRLGFDVIDGEGYESRDIPEKVADRIRSQDILLLLVTPGDSTWVLSEAAYAKGKNKYIVALVQDGLTPNKGIIGSDHEHITFPEGRIEKAFNDLLFALPI